MLAGTELERRPVSDRKSSTQAAFACSCLVTTAARLHQHPPRARKPMCSGQCAVAVLVLALHATLVLPGDCSAASQYGNRGGHAAHHLHTRAAGATGAAQTGATVDKVLGVLHKVSEAHRIFSRQPLRGSAKMISATVVLPGDCSTIKHSSKGGHAAHHHHTRAAGVTAAAITVDKVLGALHKMSVVQAIQKLYSIHNPDHDWRMLVNKYRGAEDELLAAVLDKYVYNPGRERVPANVDEEQVHEELYRHRTLAQGIATTVEEHMDSSRLEGCIHVCCNGVRCVACGALLIAIGSRCSREVRRTHRDTIKGKVMCPISLEPMVDPVLLVESGQTYERAQIEQWLIAHSTDPISNMTLTSKSFVPNRALRHVIEGSP